MSAAPTEVGGGVSQTTEALQAKLEETKISEEKPVTAEQDDQDDQDDDEAPVAGGDADKKKKKKSVASSSNMYWRIVIAHTTKIPYRL